MEVIFYYSATHIGIIPVCDNPSDPFIYGHLQNLLYQWVKFSDGQVFICFNANFTIPHPKFAQKQTSVTKNGNI
jgi:hypothetical protein